MKIKKLFLLLISFFCCQSFFCEPLESNIELANKYYDFDEIKKSPVCLAVFLCAVIISLIISFIANINSPFPCNILYFILSSFTKIILILTAPLILLSIITSFSTGDKDRRYKDGTRNNKKTSSVVLIFSLIGLLVLPLVKTKGKSKISKIIDDFGDTDYTSNYFRNQNRR